MLANPQPGNADEKYRQGFLRSYLENNGEAALGGDPAVLGKVAGYDPKLAVGLQDNAREQKKFSREQATARLDEIAGALSGANDPASYAQAIQFLKSRGHDISPEEENFANKDYLLSQATGLKEKLAQMSDDRKFNADQAWRGTQANQWQQSFNADERYRNAQLGIERDKMANPNPTDDMREYSLAQKDPKFAEFLKNKPGGTTVNVGGEPALNKELSKAEGKAWAGHLDAANVAGGMMQDMQALDELIGVAPQGPLTGRLAEMFPGFSSAGDAFQSIVKRVAPSLRTPGSGSTSDVEYNGFLQSVPGLSRSQQGNQIISAMIKAKAQINIERGEIVGAYQNGEITAQDARRKILDLNRRSIMTPEMKSLIQRLTGQSNNSGGKSDRSMTGRTRSGISFQVQ
jgi:hypothetical protein